MDYKNVEPLFLIGMLSLVRHKILRYRTISYPNFLFENPENVNFRVEWGAKLEKR
jgi:hypothetical protein